MNKIITVGAIALVIGGAGGFFGGMKYDQSKTTSARAGFQSLRQNGGQAGIGANFAGRGGGSGMSGSAGDIIAKDDKSITIKMRDGSSKIIFYSPGSEVGKFVSGSVGDLKIGNSVMVTGTTNSDGSITAQNIQIRPAVTATPQPQQ